MAAKSLCSVNGCGKPVRTLGYCQIHYNRFWRLGDATIGGPIKSRGAPTRFLRSHVLYAGAECLLWPFERNNLGYAVVSKNGKKVSAARIMCQLAHGDPTDRALDTAHSCGNGHQGCVHPQHLSWKTRLGNMQDAMLHGTTTKGEKNPQASLTEKDVRAIRAMKGAMYKDIAPVFGITPSAVGLIMRGERWGWLE